MPIPYVPQSRPRVVLRGLARLAAAGGIVVFLLAAWAGWLQLTGNVHTTLPGELYRSAQPDRAALTRAVETHGIRSVLNLRGPNPGKDWYDREIDASNDLGLVHADFALSARREPDAQRMADLIALMKSLPKPLLIHCRSGADRTGLAAALYLAALKDVPEAQAAGQLSFAFGHVSAAWLSKAAAMDRAFADWTAERPS
ncbi:tyrosine-protein phosphatase [Pseudooceanicola sp. CBS1P-1]|uniref:Protein tyrosine phosphatase n=2 Tax=Paracoccaceae TaxID=31989 RepID=A0A6L7G9C7_9RHOB|nr:tyrosine-protein phosphatase [Pseudooceanicola endophyticus]MXN20252.1 protein tyrosine phosphatase [Pseudooceanicola albus]